VRQGVRTAFSLAMAASSSDMPFSAALAQSVEAPQSSPVDMLVAAIKLGQSEQAKSLMAQFPEALDEFDTQDGATPVHWAALFGHVDLLQAFIAAGARVDVTIKSTGMQPLHWAATKGHVEIIKLLLARGVNINEVDIKKTTALLIAAQYDHTVLVFFLVKEGADISLLDDCSDSALHWAAYKKNLQTVALLHYLGLPADAADSYGSTPLHLAAARNAPHVIEYLIDESTSSIEELAKLKDAKGRTPLDVAKEKGNALSVRLLQKVNPSCRARMLGFFMGNDGSKFLFFFYLGGAAFAYLVYGLYFSQAVGSQLQHIIFFSMNALMQITYFRVHTGDPGTVSIGIEARQNYEAALQSAADGTLAEASSLPLCHTCRIVKPLRSKHCQVAKRCVPMFDHYCPYINNTIGGGNYMAFIQFIFVGMICQIATLASAIQYLVTVNYLSPLAWAVACFFTMSTLMAVMMNQYHATLILQQLTTNEHMNRHRYHYLRNDLGQYKNAFSRGKWENIKEFFSRGSTIRNNAYYHSDVYQKLLKSRDLELGDMTDSGSTTDGSECGDEGILLQSSHSHGHSHGHSH